MIALICFIITLLTVAIIDLKTQSIYDIVLLIGAAICYPLLVFMYKMPISQIAIGAAVGFGLYWLIHIVTKLIYKDEVFGMGDVLFNTFICGFLGPLPGVLTSFLTFFVAMALVLLGWIIKRKVDREARIPLAPAMAIAAVITYFYYEPIIAFIYGLSGR